MKYLTDLLLLIAKFNRDYPEYRMEIELLEDHRLRVTFPFDTKIESTIHDDNKIRELANYVEGYTRSFEHVLKSNQKGGTHGTL